MRILIDECLDWRLCQSLADHACTSVQRMGWGGLANGELLRKAEQEFDVFLTGDRNLAFQQAPENFDIAVVVLHSESIQLKHTLPPYAARIRASANAQAWRNCRCSPQ